MARIRARTEDGRLRVVVSGALGAADLRTLERACGPALEQRDVALDIEAGDVSAVDEASRVFLVGLSRRGAAVTWPDCCASGGGPATRRG
ncbi:MAG: hypothetical protein AB7G23_15350 [Vicinamibacterales bacterium]